MLNKILHEVSNESNNRHCRIALRRIHIVLYLRCYFGFALLLFIVQQDVIAANGCRPWPVKIESIQGNVKIIRTKGPLLQQVKLQDGFCAGDQLIIEAKSRAVILISDQTVIRLDEATLVTFSGPQADESFWINLIKGAIHFFSRTPSKLSIRTPFVNAGVEGTEFLLTVDENQTLLSVFEGNVWFNNAYGGMMVAGGDSALAEKGKAPRPELIINPREAVQWALYYPPIFDLRKNRPDIPQLEYALDNYRSGDLSGAFEELEKTSPELRDEDYYNLKAGLLLIVGRVSEAETNIEKTLSVDSANGSAYALKAIIALAQNTLDTTAYAFALKALELSSGSPLPYVAMSYVQQAGFELNESLKTIEQAVRLAPTDPLALSRLAELQLSLGDLDRGLEAAQRAASVEPNLARTQTILGFAALTKIEVEDAVAAFNKAISLDSADPLPRLGLGLAKIRQGDLAEGAQEIAIAASLDPNNSLLRSYLGKAYFEQNLDRAAGVEFNIAKYLDRKDPTPWLYDAFRKQSGNQPVEALHDIKESTERNNNRALYRSRLLLDQDQAVRGASLARIYDDLGFENLASAESAKSLSQDPANHSAHRFLSDSYVRLPRRGIAQVSELLQAQLLQPININPVQPQLSIRGVSMVAGAIPALTTFNEYTSLFERDRSEFTLSGVVGSNATYADEAVLSGVYGRSSYSLGQFHYETDGFRDNSDTQHDIYNVFGQWALTNKLNIQAEIRRRDTEQGNPALNLDPRFILRQRRELDHDIGRLGLRWSPKAGSNFLGSFIYSERIESLFEQRESSSLKIVDERPGYEVEGQYLLSDERFNLILGGGLYQVDGSEEKTATFGSQRFPFDTVRVDIKGENVYTYANIKFPEQFVWTLGLSYESYNEQIGRQFDIHKVNPKLGLRWDIAHWLGLRAVYLRNIKRLLAVDQTIEPTQVAGFNQFFDDFNGTSAEILGTGIDVAISDDLYGGVAFTQRELTQSDEIVTKEDYYRTYFYWTPHPHWSASIEHQLEQDERKGFELETQSAPFSIRYFAPQGLFVQLNSTFVRQKMRLDTERFEDEFEVIDAVIGYRLPRRRGIVSVEASNIFDREFQFQDSLFKTSDQFNVIRSFEPDLTIFTRLILNF